MRCLPHAATTRGGREHHQLEVRPGFKWRRQETRRPGAGVGQMGRINKVKTFPVLNHNACVIFTFFVYVVLNVKTYSSKFVIGIDKRERSQVDIVNKEHIYTWCSNNIMSKKVKFIIFRANQRNSKQILHNNSVQVPLLTSSVPGPVAGAEWAGPGPGLQPHQPHQRHARASPHHLSQPEPLSP